MYKIGIDFGGTNIAAGLIDENNQIIQRTNLPTRKEKGMEGVCEDIATCCATLTEQAGIATKDISVLGVASPGTINSVSGVIEYYSGMNVRNYPLAEKLRKLTGISEVRAENDANAAALAEAVVGAAQGAAHSVTVTLGTGVGGGIIIDGKVYSGFNHSAAELGHIVIVHGGESCSCGRRGCWESYSSATALIRMTCAAMEGNLISELHTIAHQDGKVSGKTAFRAAEAGDSAATKVVRDYIAYLATGITNIINIFQPEVLCIGGGISGEGENLLVPLRKLVDGEQYARTTPHKTRIVTAKLGNDAGIIGAALL
ncbi:MAG: ROK family protein [Oscillospiraceae bacterium]|nr:ROK family protein [Oscillospiraceae bacterium]